MTRVPVQDSPSRIASARGFTLIEAVVALAILSLLMTTVLAALRAFGNTQRSMEALVDRTDEVRAVGSFLREALEASVVGTSRGGGGGLGFGGAVSGAATELAEFQGNENGFRWKARMVFGESYGGTMLLLVTRVDDQLVLYWQRPPPPDRVIEWEDDLSRVLVNRLEEFEVAYRGAPGTDWVTAWQQNERPELLRLTIKADDRFWPDLVMVVPQ